METDRIITGKTVCLECLHYGDTDIGHCHFKKEKIPDYVTGEVVEMYIACYKKNRNGMCPDYLPEDFNARWDLYMHRTTEQLRNDLAHIVRWTQWEAACKAAMSPLTPPWNSRGRIFQPPQLKEPPCPALNN